MDLTVHQLALLEMERRWPRHCGDKIQAVRERFDLTIAAYEAQVDAVVLAPSAKDHDAELVRRIARQRGGVKWFIEKQTEDWH